MNETQKDEEIVGVVFQTKSVVNYLFATKPGKQIVQGQLVEVDFKKETEDGALETYLARITMITHQNFIIDQMGSVQLSSMYEQTPGLKLEDLNLGGSIEDYVIGEIEIIGRRERGSFVRPNTLLKIGSKIRKATDDFLNEQIKPEGDFIELGSFRFNNRIPINLSLDKLITLHFCILAMTGGGKSWTVSVLTEQIAKNYELPIIIFDPHGEYSAFLVQNEDLQKTEDIETFNKIKNKIKIFIAGDQSIINRRNLLFKEKYLFERKTEKLLIDLLDLTTYQLIYIIDELHSLSEPQKRILLETWTDVRDKKSVLKNPTDLDEIMEAVFKEYKEKVFPKTKEILKTKIKLFYRDSGFIRRNITDSTINIEKLVKKNQISIIDISALDNEHQQILVGTICDQILKYRIQDLVPPLLVILEEAHKFIPGKNLASASKSVIARIAQEGRKFMMGLGIVSQRPSRLDPDVLSQCNTQIIMRLTNPNDQNYVRQISEYVTDTDLELIRSLSPGEGIAFGSSILFSLPIKVKQERYTMHGGYIPSLTEALRKWKEK